MARPATRRQPFGGPTVITWFVANVVSAISLIVAYERPGNSFVLLATVVICIAIVALGASLVASERILVDRGLDPNAIKLIMASVAASGGLIAFLIGALSDSSSSAVASGRTEIVLTAGVIVLVALPAVWFAMIGVRRPLAVLLVSAAIALVALTLLGADLTGRTELFLALAVVVGSVVSAADRSSRSSARYEPSGTTLDVESIFKFAAKVAIIGTFVALSLVLDIGARHLA